MAKQKNAIKVKVTKCKNLIRITILANTYCKMADLAKALKKVYKRLPDSKKIELSVLPKQRRII